MNHKQNMRENIIVPNLLIDVFHVEDSRGKLTKCFSNDLLSEYGFQFDIEETLIIRSGKNVLRGLHFQKNIPVEKLLTCIQGKLYAVVVDIRPNSTSFGKWDAIEMEEDMMIYVPKGYALGTYAFEDSSMLCMNSEKNYSEYSAGIIWDDRTLNISWPCIENGDDPILSEKDQKLQSFNDYINNGFLVYGEV